MPERALLLVLLLPTRALAAPPATTGYTTVLIALLLILGGFVLVAWLAQRWLPRARAQGPVRVVGSAAVGARERVVVVEVADTWLVLGVGAGQVRHLHQMPKPRGGAQ